MARLVAIALLLAYLTLGERIALGRQPGFPGLPVLEVAFVGAAFVAWLAAGRPRPVVRGGWVVSAGPLFTLLLVLPLAGLGLGTYGVTTLYSWMTVLVPLAVLAVTVTDSRAVLHAAHAAVVVHGTYGLAQALSRAGMLPASVWGWAGRWDLDTQRSLNDAYVIAGRSTGLFINPNVFALWSVLGVVLAYRYLRGWRRGTGLVLAVSGVLTSQSRTGLLCLLVLVAVWALRAVAGRGDAGRLLARLAVVALPVLWLVVLTGGLGRLLQTGLLGRVGTALRIATEGVQGDRNLLGRVEAWRLAAEYSPADPRLALGTLGPPQVHFPGIIDNQYVAFYLQGGVLFVAAFVMALLAPLALRARGVPEVGALGVCCFVIAVMSLTMMPLYAAQSTALLWVVAGLTVSVSGQGGPSRQGQPPPPDARNRARARTAVW